jgi:signal transduction histidine kinase
MTMRERAELTGGSFHLRSVPGQGTTIQVTWPSYCPRERGAAARPC